MAKNSEVEETTEPNENDGITAIITLQALAGINETEEEARAGWRRMCVHQKRNTLMAYRILVVEPDVTTVN